MPAPLPSAREAAIKRARWLLLPLPCASGALFWLVGWARDPRVPGQNVLAHQQALQLYTAGEASLAGGVLMAAFITWKILRPPPADEEEKES